MNHVLVKPLRVLVVDDELGMCLGATRVLEAFSPLIQSLDTTVQFSLQHVTSGEAFMALHETEKFDLYLLDYKLPDADGLDLLQHIAKTHADFLAVIITAFATLETAVQATKLGAFDFLAKPFTPEELRMVMTKAATHLLLSRHARTVEEERRKVKFQFVSVLAHELKAPIAAIEGYLNILTTEPSQVSSDDAQMMLQRSQIRLNGMKKLIFDLLDMTRIESGEKKRRLESCSVTALARNAMEAVSFLARERGISLHLQAPDELLFLADASELEIIFNNLISNAVKYNKEKGRVDILIQDLGDQIVIRVSDTGLGLSLEDQARLFQDFVRIKNSETMHIQGSGLGLSTVRKIAKLYAGTARVESQPLVGSAFTVELKKTSTPH